MCTANSILRLIIRAVWREDGNIAGGIIIGGRPPTSAIMKHWQAAASGCLSVLRPSSSLQEKEGTAGKCTRRALAQCSARGNIYCINGR